MKHYHPLDTRYKAPPQPSGLRRVVPDAGTSTRPWQMTSAVTAPWEREGPIKDDPRVEERKRQKHGRQVEDEERRKAPLLANLFSPLALFYQGRAMFRGKQAMGHSKASIALQIAGAIVLYFMLMNADQAFGINDTLGRGGVQSTSLSFQTVQQD